MIKRLVMEIQNNKALTSFHLDISKNAIGLDGAEGLATALSINSNIESLNCACMGLKAKGVAMILDKIQPSVKTLLIDENFDGPDRIELGKALANILGKESLKTLSICGRTTPLGEVLIPVFSMYLFFASLFHSIISFHYCYSILFAYYF